ncbi:DUF2797 domain-containing protein [Acinetobacter bereziniae]|uniref:DUF2797 domain-containing protein n=1 Tax=Acinetobacter bereziniae TaxID=106648 RepID=UPI0018DB79A8|nr:DUF2797 domain-containing protein [Acinetobacter bereziniae]MBI0393865.1 DUF2797 domain-containing protein [Acinetobacter bereziniae]MBJ9948992.1 DUF2797 domain-containing protein [Acinetobacter bereziniae]MDQ9821683.1 DUF2797 domain-containing protein [Acinetobacter bereziniae]
MELQGICHKMHAGLKDLSLTDQQTHKANVEYKFILDRSEIELPFSLGQEIEIEATGNIYCVSCGAKTPKSYSQGHCFKCMKTKASCDICIMKPETCHYHLGTCREDDFAHEVCFQPHIVYLANSSALKVGITRLGQMPTRWLDQGATQALPIMKVGSRRLSGQLEVMFGSQVADKTDWRKLLKGEAEPINLIEIRNELVQEFAPKIQSIRDEFAQHLEFNETVELLEEELPREFVYPVDIYPEKIKSHNLDKTPIIRGKLQGIKGQYLIMDTGVINIRKYTGYELKVRAE